MKRVVPVCICILLCLVYPAFIYGAQSAGAAQTGGTGEFVSDDRGIEVMFIIDCSGSMRKNDPSRTAVGMVIDRKSVV